jgi:hypothetical protein
MMVLHLKGRIIPSPRLARAAAFLLLATGCGDAATPVPPDAAVDAAVELDAAVTPDVPDEPDGAVEATLDAAPVLDAAPDLGPAPHARPSYARLAETGLYQDVAARTLGQGLVEFTPSYPLWSDRAEKHRWIRLPPGTQVDTSDMDHWVFPVGTQLWKEFALGGTALETRLIERYGTGPEDYWMGSFVWRADGSDADLVPDGQKDIGDSTHDAPSQKDCRYCHAGERGRVLGFSALQLSREGPGVTLDGLRQAGLLSAPPPAGAPFHPPGDPATAAALGYLHANCGHCHNPNGTSWPDTPMMLRLAVAEKTPEETALYRSSIGQTLNYWRHAGFSQRVVAGDPDTSAMSYRVASRVKGDGMPPLATEEVDGQGLELVRAWIRSLPHVP